MLRVFSVIENALKVVAFSSCLFLMITGFVRGSRFCQKRENRWFWSLIMSHVITSSYNHFIIMRTHRWPYGPCWSISRLLERNSKMKISQCRYSIDVSFSTKTRPIRPTMRPHDDEMIVWWWDYMRHHYLRSKSSIFPFLTKAWPTDRRTDGRSYRDARTHLNKAHTANDASSWWWNDCLMMW